MKLLQVVSRPQLSSCFFSHIPSRVPSSKGTTFGRKWNSAMIAVYSSAQEGSGQINERRSANYKPNVLSYNLLQSLDNIHSLEMHKDRIQILEKEVRNALLNHESYYDDPTCLTILERIDDIQRLGLIYRFEEDVKNTLPSLPANMEQIHSNGELSNKTLHAVSLSFRLRRQHGLDTSQDAFKRFMDNQGNVKNSSDIQGMLSLYEAAHLATEGDYLLQEAKACVTKHLQCYIETNYKRIEENLVLEQLNHALELPLHRRISLQESQWYIKAYSRRPNTDSTLLELAVLEFNLVQSIYKEDLHFFSRWWESMGLTKSLSFARDRPVECFCWGLGMAQHPQLSNCRRHLSKVAAFIIVIDDIYDIYGLPHELKMFTEAVERWDIHSMNDLPEYMKLCFLALYNTVNEIGYDVLKEHGVNIIPNLAKSWVDLFKASLEEAKWSRDKFTPKFGEYLKNGRVSIAGHVMLVHSYFLTTPTITKEATESLQNYDDVLPWPSTVIRLINDLASSSVELERGETANSISCYMMETGASEEDAREHINELTDLSWRKMNEYHQGCGSKFDESFLQIALDLARTGHFMYVDGDALGNPDVKSNKDMHSLIFEPISLKE